MFGYREFPEDVREVFADLLNKFELAELESSESSITFSSLKCKLTICIDGENIDAYFLEKGTTYTDNKFYNINNVLEFIDANLSYKVNHTMLHNRDKFRMEMRNLVAILEKHCRHILIDGDFSWTPQYNDFLKTRALKQWGDKYNP